MGDAKTLVFPGDFHDFACMRDWSQVFSSRLARALRVEKVGRNMSRQFCVRPAADALLIRGGATNVLPFFYYDGLPRLG
jgi:hypothetical protein